MMLGGFLTFIAALLLVTPPAMSLDYMPMVDGAETRHRWSSGTARDDLSTGGEIITRVRVTDSAFPECRTFIYDMDQGTKLEWFLRRQRDGMVEILLWKSVGIDPDGVRRAYRLDPPALLWKWPIETTDEFPMSGSGWSEAPYLVIDEGARIPTVTRVEVLSEAVEVHVPAGIFGRTMAIRIQYDSHFGRDESIFHLADGVGVVRELQTVHDGSVRKTELISSSLLPPMAGIELSASDSRITPGGAINLDILLTGAISRGDYRCYLGLDTGIEVYYFTETKGFIAQPAMTALDQQGTRTVNWRLPDLADFQAPSTFRWLAMPVDCAHGYRRGRPVSLNLSVPP